LLLKRDFRKFGKFLKKRRIKAKLTQMDVAKNLGCHSQFISNIERGLCAPPFKTLKTLTELYRINSGELIKLIIREEKNYLEKMLLHGKVK
jgi:transcriptional regulator with XRE-family HTH domain